MPRKKGYKTPDEIREKIQGSMLINRLQENVQNECMTAAQVNSAKILLNKIIPDLKAIEHSGDEDSPMTLKVVIGGD